MTCQELVRCLSDYIDGTLAPAARAEAEVHLADCDKCHLVLDTTQCTILLCRAAQSPGLDAARRQALLRRLERACRAAGLPIGQRSRPFPRRPEGVPVYPPPLPPGG